MTLSLPAIETRARGLRLLIFDVDGVLTDGSVLLHPDGSELKSFFIRDGSAMVRARQDGLELGLLSGRSSPVTARRATELGISIVVQGKNDKLAGYLEILKRTGVTEDQAAYMGDDLLDLPALERAGLSAAPSDAADEVRARVNWISQFAGGRGAVREFIDMILAARNQRRGAQS